MLTISPRRCGTISGAARRLAVTCARTPAVNMPVPLVQRLLPEGHQRQRLALAVLVAAPHVVDQQIEPTMVRPDLREHGVHLGIHRVVAADRDPPSAPRRHLACSVVNRARHVVGGRTTGNASPGHVDGGTSGAELGRNAATGAAARARDQCNLVVEWFHRRPSVPRHMVAVSGPENMATMVTAAPCTTNMASLSCAYARELNRPAHRNLM